MIVIELFRTASTQFKSFMKVNEFLLNKKLDYQILFRVSFSQDNSLGYYFNSLLWLIEIM